MVRYCLAAEDNLNLIAVTKRRKKILVTGASGGLGRYFRNNWPSGDCLVLSNRDATGGMLHLDLADAKLVEDVIASEAPTDVIHCAALADVDKCEREPEAAYLANVQATRFLVNALKHRCPDSKLVYISTDQVYAGPGPSSEITPAHPCNMYGWTKLWGEDISLQLPRTLVLRLNYVGIGTERKPGLARWISNSAANGVGVTLFKDVLFNPLHGRHIPQLMHMLLEQDT
ncbi:MAG: sugar nucleotide-binding protein, partial [Ferrovibrio sp.]